ncbi:hypothetical protein SEVIR_4G118905v4 [Setaria viridis]
MPLKEAAQKVEAKIVQEETAALPLPQSKVKSGRTKRSAQRTYFPLRKQLAKRVKPVGNLPPLAPKPKMILEKEGGGASRQDGSDGDRENKQKDATPTNESISPDGDRENDARVVVYARKHKDNKAAEVEKAPQAEDTLQKETTNMIRQQTQLATLSKLCGNF